jgi:hypothetical protein
MPKVNVKESFYYELWVNDGDDLPDTFTNEMCSEDSVSLEFIDNELEFFDLDWNEVR